MRSVILRGVLVLSVLGLGTMGCQRQEGEESQEYEAQGGGHERVNLPEQTRDDQGARMNVETGKQDGQQKEPGQQQENRYQAGGGQGTATQGGTQESGSQGAGTQDAQRR
jgi:hypothetical protein